MEIPKLFVCKIHGCAAFGIPIKLQVNNITSVSLESLGHCNECGYELVTLSKKERIDLVLNCGCTLRSLSDLKEKEVALINEKELYIGVDNDEDEDEYLLGVYTQAVIHKIRNHITRFVWDGILKQIMHYWYDEKYIAIFKLDGKYRYISNKDYYRNWKNKLQDICVCHSCLDNIETLTKVEPYFAYAEENKFRTIGLTE